MLNSNKAIERETPLNRALRLAAGNSFYYAACAALLAVAAALRFHDLAGHDIHYDEAVDVLQARGSIAEIIERLRCCGVHPIARPLLLGAAQLASVSEFSVRAPSAFASVLTVGALVILLPRVGVGKPVGFLAGLMAALSPAAILHARVYGVDALVAALMIVGLLAYLKSGKKALLCVSLFLAPLTQYGLMLFAAAALAALAAAKAIAYFSPQRTEEEANVVRRTPPGAGRHVALGVVRLPRSYSIPPPTARPTRKPRPESRTPAPASTSISTERGERSPLRGRRAPRPTSKILSSCTLRRSGSVTCRRTGGRPATRTWISISVCAASCSTASAPRKFLSPNTLSRPSEQGSSSGAGTRFGERAFDNPALMGRSAPIHS